MTQTAANIPCQDWHELHADSPLLAEIGKALCAAGVFDAPKILRRRDGYDVTYRIVAGAKDKSIVLHCGHEKAAHGSLAAQIVSEFLKP